MTLKDNHIEILRYLSNGFISKEIGALTEKSPRTIEKYIERMKLANSCKSIAQLVAEAIRNKIIE